MDAARGRRLASPELWGAGRRLPTRGWHNTMMASTTTPRGQATRDRIIDTAGRLMHDRGVDAVSLDQVLDAAGAGKGQLYHYFANKEELLAAVAEEQASRILQGQGDCQLDSWEGIAAWFDAVVSVHHSTGCNGCPVGSLAAELAAADHPEVHARIKAFFASYVGALADGLTVMRDRGDLVATADPASLAAFVVSVQQGGGILAIAVKDVAPLRQALDHAYAYLRGFASDAAGPG